MNLIKNILTTLHFTKIISIEKLTSRSDNSIYKVNFRKLQLIIKCYSKIKSFENEKQVYSIIQNNKIPIAKPFYFGSVPLMNNYYAIFEYIPKNNLKTLLKVKKNSYLAEYAGNVLHDFHSINLSNYEINEFAMFNPNDLKDIIANTTNYLFDKKVITSYEKDKYTSMVYDLKQHPLKYKLLHGDFNPSQLLVDNNGIKALLDFENVYIAPVEIDIANAILQFKICNPDTESHFLKGYKNLDTLSSEAINQYLIILTLQLIYETCYYGKESKVKKYMSLLKKIN